MPPLIELVVDANATVPAVRCPVAKAVTSTVWLPAEAVLSADAVNDVVSLLLTTILLKSLTSFKSSKAVFKLFKAYFMAAMPDTIASFFLMFLSIAD